MPSPKVLVKTLDLTNRVPSFEGVYGAIVLPAKKGPIDQPFLVDSDTRFLSKFTPEGTIKVGYDNSHFSALNFLERSDKLWAIRAVNGALFGGLGISPSTVARNHTALGTGLADPTAYDYVEIVETAVAGVHTYTFTGLTPEGLQGKSVFLSGRQRYVWFTFDGNGSDPAFVSLTGTVCALVTGDTPATIATKFAAAVDALAAYTAAAALTVATVTNAAVGPALVATDINSGIVVANTVVGSSAITIEECLFLYQADPGVWGDSVYTKITNYTDNPQAVATPGAFLVEVFLAGNLATPVESFVCSRVQGAKDGFGRNIYVNDRLEESEYIRGLNNVTVDEAVLPKSSDAPIQFGGGDDGDAVSDSHMITALQKFSNPDDIPTTLILDGGWATPAYQQAINTIASNRGDCVGILSTPYAREASANYLNEIVDYRRNVLNLNSSFSALYAGWVRAYDRFNDRNIYVSPDGYAGAVISFTANQFEIWFPPAGYRRGVITALDLRRRFTESERDFLYDNGVNPFRFAPGKGIAIFGQKTLQSNASSLDRLNVRFLLVVIQPAIKDFLENFLFEFNDEATRSQVRTLIDQYMESIKAARGVTDFLTVCDGSNNTPQVIDSNELRVNLFIKPSRSAETIVFTTILTPTGVSFTDVAVQAA